LKTRKKCFLIHNLIHYMRRIQKINHKKYRFQK
jgi:hypothetical protein